MLYCFLVCHGPMIRSHMVASDHAVTVCNSSQWNPGQGINDAMHSWVMTGLLGPLAGHLVHLYRVPPASLTGFSFLPIKIMFQALGWNFDSLLSWGQLDPPLQKLDESHIRFKGCSEAGAREGLRWSRGILSTGGRQGGGCVALEERMRFHYYQLYVGPRLSSPSC